MKHDPNKPQKPGWIKDGLGSDYCENCGVNKSDHKRYCEIKKGHYPA